MIANKLKILFLMVLLVAGCLTRWSSTQIKSQSNNTAVVSNKNNQANSESKVYGEIVPIRYNGDDLRQFTLSQPLPDIWLFVKENNDSAKVKINLSEEAKNILTEYWVKTLKHRYITEFDELSKNVSYQKEDVILVQSNIDTGKVLLKTRIKSDENSRNFSAEEVHQLSVLIRDKSGEVIQKIKEIKSQTVANTN